MINSTQFCIDLILYVVSTVVECTCMHLQIYSKSLPTFELESVVCTFYAEVLGSPAGGVHYLVL